VLMACKQRFSGTDGRRLVVPRKMVSTGMIRAVVARIVRWPEWPLPHLCPDGWIIAETAHCFQAHVTAGHGPLVVLLEQDCAETRWTMASSLGNMLVTLVRLDLTIEALERIAQASHVLVCPRASAYRIGRGYDE